MNGYQNIFSASQNPAYLQAPRIYYLALAMGLLSYLVFAISLAGSQHLITPMGQPVGGDFMVFWVAAQAVIEGAATEIYEFTTFSEYLLKLGPPMEEANLSWQYPPTYYFLVMPLAFLPFGLGYMIWSGGSALLFGFTCKKIFNLTVLKTALLLVTPLAFVSVLTGQNGFITATLLLVAAAMPDKRPILAGICAGLLTIKPQLGLLLPFAYIAGGYWRSFLTAAGVSLFLIAATVGIFGPDIWSAFFASVGSARDLIQQGLFPLERMRTIYGTAVLFGLPTNLAMILQLTTAMLAVIATAWIWWSIRAMDLRVAFLLSAVFLCTPYGYHYETTLLLPALIILLQRAATTQSWYKAEEIFIAAFWAYALLQSSMPDLMKPLLGLIMTNMLLALIIRRCVLEEGLRLPDFRNKVYIPIGI